MPHLFLLSRARVQAALPASLRIPIQRHESAEAASLQEACPSLPYYSLLGWRSEAGAATRVTHAIERVDGRLTCRQHRVCTSAFLHSISHAISISDSDRDRDTVHLLNIGCYSPLSTLLAALSTTSSAGSLCFVAVRGFSSFCCATCAMKTRETRILSFLHRARSRAAIACRPPTVYSQHFMITSLGDRMLLIIIKTCVLTRSPLCRIGNSLKTVNLDGIAATARWQRAKEQVRQRHAIGRASQVL